MTENLISVIVPVYKVEAYLDRCVQSIVDQSYRNLEIILVDDGSTDACPSMCDSWAEKDPRISVIHKANGGLSDARNAGMSAATGEYISFIDSDDWIAPEMLERLVAAMERDDSDISACAVEMVWEDGTPSKLLTVQKECVLDRQSAQRELLAENLLKQPVWYKLYRRDLIKDILFPVGKLHEDVFWSYRAVDKSRRVSIIDYKGYFYFQRNGSIMGESYSLKRLDAVEAWIERFAYYKDNRSELADDAGIKLLNGCIYQGQMALRYLRLEERKKAIAYLQSVFRTHMHEVKAFERLKLSHRIWLWTAYTSLSFTCKIKNLCRIGL